MNPAGASAASPSATNASPTPPVRSASRLPAQREQDAAQPTAKRTEHAKHKAKKVKVRTRGSGIFRYARVNGQAASKRGRIIRYGVRVEKGLPFDVKASARVIQKILNDKRSWRGSGQYRFQLVRSAQKAQLHVSIATPQTTDQLCAPYLTRGLVSCQNGNRVVFNARRWAFGAKSYGHDVTNYRRYLVNHEFGHALGFGHVVCSGKGNRAPVMMQQTKGLGGCRPNAWPAPTRR